MQTEKPPIYPVEPWSVTETAFCPEYNYRNETTFSLSNGYLGTRGTFEEAYPFDIDTGLEGNFINGFYESENIRYGEANFGSPLHSQSLLNLPNLKETHLKFEGEVFDMRAGRLEEYSRTLSMREGVVYRSLVWTSPGGRQVKIRIQRLVSFAMKNIMALRFEVTPLNFDGEIRLCSVLDGDVENHTRKTNPIVDYGPFGRRLEPSRLCADEKEGSLYYEGETKNSHLTVACGGRHILPEGFACIGKEEERLRAGLTFAGKGKKGSTLIFDKLICYASDLDMEKKALFDFTDRTLEQACLLGFARLKKCQKETMHQFWERADICIEGENSDILTQGLRFNLFHIFQSAGRDGRTGMGAKGLSGEGYEGHYFWDTEMYMLPVFIYTQPEVAKNLLHYRYQTLRQARERARVLGHEKGALFPWRTINGEEASTYFPLGTAQYHINADIAYALCLYLQVTGDLAFFRDEGAELLIETARIWADVGCFAECRGGKYCICDVTGPDEYNVLVDNNFYTNLMAREHLRAAVQAVAYLENNDPESLKRLEKTIGFAPVETGLWKEIVKRMYFPYDETRQIYPMDDGFLMRKPWDESKIPPEKRAWLYENYHPLFIMRHRMSKQADAVLGMYLHSSFFTGEELKRNYDFYQEVTLHHSSLSTCIFGIVACDIGVRLQDSSYLEEAYRYFTQSARMDLDDYHRNFYAGIHGANMAGTWQAMVNGFAGLRCVQGRLSFQPCLPEAWEGYRFRLEVRGNLLEAEVRRDAVTFLLREGTGISILVYGQEVCLKEAGESCKLELRAMR